MEKKKKFNPASVPIYYLEDPEGNGLTEEQTRAVWQHGVNTGQVWSLQGWYGRTAQELLNAGVIDYPKKETHDAYGNKIPTQADIKKQFGKYETAKKRRKLKETS